ncbi:MAG TPA: oligosaccharide flippase family protein [Clostridia bacterium]|nr:oligosaccharide flippase family protein [Clostridia bacterium]
MSSRKQSFIKGAAILAVAGIISKILGAIYRIPLGRIIGSEGMAYYQTAYELYILMLTISAYSIPIAISKLVSEKIELGRRDEAHKTFRVALTLIAFLGFTLSALLFFNAQGFVASVKNPGAYVAVLCVAPAIFTVSLSGAFRGYFQGMQNMTPSGISQVTEQIARVVFGFILAIIFLPAGYETAAGGAVFGTTIGGLVSFLTLIYIYRKRRSEIKLGIRSTGNMKMDSALSIAKRIVIFSVPITIGGSIMPVMTVIDTFIVMDRLQSAGFSLETATSLLGQLKGMAGAFINLPQVFTIALAASLVPAISESIARNDFGGAARKSELAIRVSLMIGLPAAFGLFTLADPIMKLMYPAEPATLGMVLRYLSTAVIFLTLVQTMTGILQGMGKERIPVINLVIGALVKVVVSYTLTTVPFINIRGAALGTVAGYAVSSALNLSAIIKYQKSNMNITKIVMKPAIATGAMMAAAYFSYRLLFEAIGRNSVATLISVAFAALVYVIVLILIKGIAAEELEMAPGGKRLSTIMKKKGLL